MKRLVIAVILALPGAAFAQVATSRADTASQASAANQGVTVTSNGYAPGIPWFTMPLTSTAAPAPANAVSFSNLSCAGTESSGTSVGPVGHSEGTLKEPPKCNGRADAVLLMQIRQTIIATQPAIATKLAMSAVGIMCRQGDATTAAMKEQGLCSDDAAPVATIQRDDARASLDNLYAGS